MNASDPRPQNAERSTTPGLGDAAAVAISFTYEHEPTADVFIGVLDGIIAYHDFLVNEAGLPRTPIVVRRVDHPNITILLASAFILAHKAAFISAATMIGNFAIACVRLRAAQLEKQAADSKQKPQPPASVLDVFRDSQKIVAAVPNLTDEQRAELLRATLRQKLPFDTLAEIDGMLKAMGVGQFVAKSVDNRK